MKKGLPRKLNDAINSKKTLVLDGAIGDALIKKLPPPQFSSLWASSYNLTHEADVVELHRSYVKAGADILTTNTFRTNYHAYKQGNYQFSYPDLVYRSVGLAIDAARASDVIIAGSNGPAEDCYKEEVTLSDSELEENHFNHINLLVDAGCDIILNETLSHFKEIEIISRICKSEGIPFVLSLYCKPDLHLLSGEHILWALDAVSKFNPLAVSVNCISIETAKELFEIYTPQHNWGIYPNCGTSNPDSGIINSVISPSEYYSEMEQFKAKQPLFIGGCCGSTDKHIRLLKTDGK